MLCLVSATSSTINTSILLLAMASHPLIDDPRRNKNDKLSLVFLILFAAKQRTDNRQIPQDGDFLDLCTLLMLDQPADYHCGPVLQAYGCISAPRTEGGIRRLKAVN